MAFSLVAKHHQVVSNFLTRSSPVATNTRGFSTKGQFYGLAVNCVQRVLLNWIPHTLCTYESDGVVKDLSLRIPGTEKRIETAEALNVFLDMETHDAYSSSIRTTLVTRVTGHNVLFITAYFSKDCNNSNARYYTSRVNLGKQHTFNTLDTDMKDGGLLVTLPKNHHHHLPEDN